MRAVHSHATSLLRPRRSVWPALSTGTYPRRRAPPETSAIRLIKIPGICIAPQYVAEDLLRAEGFNEFTTSSRKQDRSRLSWSPAARRTSA